MAGYTLFEQRLKQSGDTGAKIADVLYKVRTKQSAPAPVMGPVAPVKTTTKTVTTSGSSGGGSSGSKIDLKSIFNSGYVPKEGDVQVSATAPITNVNYTGGGGGGDGVVSTTGTTTTSSYSRDVLNLTDGGSFKPIEPTYPVPVGVTQEQTSGTGTSTTAELLGGGGTTQVNLPTGRGTIQQVTTIGGTVTDTGTVSTGSGRTSGGTSVVTGETIGGGRGGADMSPQAILNAETERRLAKQYFIGMSDEPGLKPWERPQYAQESPYQVQEGYNPATMNIGTQSIYGQLESGVQSNIDLARQNIDISQQNILTAEKAGQMIGESDALINQIKGYKPGETIQYWTTDETGNQVLKTSKQEDLLREAQDWRQNLFDISSKKETYTQDLLSSQSVLRSLTQEQSSIGKYKTLGYDVSMTDGGYTFGLPKASEVYVWKHGEELSGVSLTSASFIKSPLAIGSLASAIQYGITGDEKVRQAEFESLSEYGLGLDRSIAKGEYIQKVASSGAVVEGILVPIATMGAGYLIGEGIGLVSTGARGITTGFTETIGSKLTPTGARLFESGSQLVTKGATGIGKVMGTKPGELLSAVGLFGVTEGQGLIEVATTRPEEFGSRLGESAFSFGLSWEAMTLGAKGAGTAERKTDYIFSENIQTEVIGGKTPSRVLTKVEEFPRGGRLEMTEYTRSPGETRLPASWEKDIVRAKGYDIIEARPSTGKLFVQEQRTPTGMDILEYSPKTGQEELMGGFNRGVPQGAPGGARGMKIGEPGELPSTMPRTADEALRYQQGMSSSRFTGEIDGYRLTVKPKEPWSTKIPEYYGEPPAPSSRLSKQPVMTEELLGETKGTTVFDIGREGKGIKSTTLEPGETGGFKKTPLKFTKEEPRFSIDSQGKTGTTTLLEKTETKIEPLKTKEGFKESGMYESPELQTGWRYEKQLSTKELVEVEKGLGGASDFWGGVRPSVVTRPMAGLFSATGQGLTRVLQQGKTTSPQIRTFTGITTDTILLDKSSGELGGMTISDIGLSKSSGELGGMTISDIGLSKSSGELGGMNIYDTISVGETGFASGNKIGEIYETGVETSMKEKQFEKELQGISNRQDFTEIQEQRQPQRTRSIQGTTQAQMQKQRLSYGLKSSLFTGTISEGKKGFERRQLINKPKEPERTKPFKPIVPRLIGGDNKKDEDEMFIKKPRKGRDLLTYRGKRKKGLPPDILSITQSQAMYGTATAPEETAGLFSTSAKNLFLRTPTKEIMKGGLKRRRLI